MVETEVMAEQDIRGLIQAEKVGPQGHEDRGRLKLEHQAIRVKGIRTIRIIRQIKIKCTERAAEIFPLLFLCSRTGESSRVSENREIWASKSSKNFWGIFENLCKNA